MQIPQWSDLNNREKEGLKLVEVVFNLGGGQTKVARNGKVFDKLVRRYPNVSYKPSYGPVAKA